jgi:hypothetical protein
MATISDETASLYYAELDTATGPDLEARRKALQEWATAKEVEQESSQWDHLTRVYGDFDNYIKSEGYADLDEESRYRVANRQFIAWQLRETPEEQATIYPTRREIYNQQTFGKKNLSEAETFNLIRDSVAARKATEDALREIPGTLAKGMFQSVAAGKPIEDSDGWFLLQNWKERHADKLASLPDGWESAMLDRATKLLVRSDNMMRDLAPESKRAFDTLLAFSRPEDAAGLPPADRADVENLAKEFAKLDPEQRQDIYSTLYYAAEADGAGMGKGFFEKVGEGLARGGVNIYDDAMMATEDRQIRENLRRLRSGDPVYPGPNDTVRLDREIVAPSGELVAMPQAVPLQEDFGTPLTEEQKTERLAQNEQRLAELKALREIRDISQGTIDPIKTEMDGVMGSIVQGAYDFSQSAAYTGMAMIPVVGLPAVMGALASSNYLRMLDAYPDMDPDAAMTISYAIAGPQAFIERFQANALIGKSPALNALMRRMTDVRIPIAGRLAIGYGANVAYQTGQEFVQEAMPVVADQIAAAIRQDMSEFDSEKAWGAYKDQMPEIFYSMLWAGLIGTGASTFRELKRNGAYERSLGELEMVGITGEAAQDIAAEQDPDAATAKFREAWDKRTPEDIQAGIRKRAAQLEAARSTQQNPELPTRRIEENPDGTLTHIIERPDGTALYRTNDSDAADMAFVNITRMVERGQITGTTTGIVESLQFIDQVNQAVARGEDIQQLVIEGAPRTLLDEYEANPTEQNLNNLFETVRAFGMDINEPAELAQFPVLASNRGALAEGIYKSVIRIQEGATGVEVMRDFSQDNLKRAIAENRITMDWVREQLNQVIPLIESERTERRLRTETDTDVIESFSDVAVAYLNGKIRDEQIPAGLRGFLRRIAIVVRDIFRRAYRLKRAIAEGKVSGDFEAFLAESVGINQQTMVDTTRERVVSSIAGNNFSIDSRATPDNDNIVVQASNATIIGPANFSIGAFHGTPHKVDRFSTEKIGTGEGAQAYGWGLYFAQAKAVGEGYRDQLGGIRLMTADGQMADNIVSTLGAKKILKEARVFWKQTKSLDGFVKQLESSKSQSKVWAAQGDNVESNSQYVKDVDEVLSVIKDTTPTPTGNLYTVELDVDDADLLDWDKPLSEQSEKVQRAIKNATADIWKTDKAKYEGSVVYNGLVEDLRNLDRNNAEKMASERLLTAGIPGIRYADQGSRQFNATDERLLELATKNNGNKEAAVDEFMRSVYDTPKAKEKMRSDLLRNFPERTYNYVVFDENLIRITEENGNRIPASEALAAPATGATNYSIGTKQSAGGIRFDEIAKEDPKHDGSRVGTAWQGKVKPTTQDTNDGIATVKPDELEKQMAMLTQFVDGVPLPKYITKFKDAQKRMRAFLDFQKGNLLALYDAFNALSADFVIRSTHWYDGARLLAEGVRDNYRLTIEQSSAIIAVFSPMKDWFQNVAMGQRFADVMANHKNKKITKAKMGGAMREMLDAAEDDKAIRKAFKQIEGRSISQLLKDKSKEGRKLAAVATRLMSTHVHGLTHDVLSPEGESLGIRKNIDGTNKKLVWQSYTFIEKAISIYEDGSAKNISKVLGTEHKIRNFYNNIVAPTSPFGDATVDTHAVNAAVLYPMGNKGYLVGLNFGQAGVAGGGNSGLYWLFHEALREAAAERGVMPRQMQSITWEAIRGLFTDVRKRDKNFVAAITKIWENSKNADSARTQIIGLGITPPEWARVAGGNPGSQGGVGEDARQTPVSAGSVQLGVRQGREGGDRRAGVADYSISSQREIDRVNRALSGVTRGPGERLATYERARARFLGLMDRNREALESLNKNTAKFRRTQILQGLGELDAILSVFPPDIRGRVGGYTRLANIAPMDVFKDGEKVSEVSGMEGAIISAWMRQGMSIGQAGKQTELPPGYTAKENLATARADKAIADFFKKRIEMIDREVEKTMRREYDEAFKKLLERTKPKRAKPGEKPKGIGADIQDLFAVLRDAVDMSATDVAAHIAGLDAKIASGELTAEQEARAQIEAALVSLVGDWRNANADRRRSAFVEANRIWSGAYAAHTQKVLEQKARRESERLDAIAATGKSGELAGRKDKAIRDSGLKGSWKDYILNLLNFDQVTGILFGENSEVANKLIDAQRMAENAKEDGAQAKMQEIEDFFTDLAGGDLLAGERLRYELAQPTMEVQGIQMSQLEALSAVMMWAQEDGRRHMTGELDENGRPSGAWHYDQVFIDEILQNLSDEALALRAWLTRNYADEYLKINEVYAELNGVNLPQIKSYSPITVQPLSAPTGQVLDPVSGSAMSGASASPGALRTRGTAIAEPRFADVLQTYISHTLQMEHWKAFAPFIAEANAVLRNRDVQNSVEEKGGAEARKILNAWLDYFAQGGTRDAGAHLALNQGLSNVLGRASQVALVGRISTILIQSTQLGAAMAEMPVKAYLKRMGQLLTGQLGWNEALNSPYIQRRIAQMPPVVQMAMQGLKGAKPTAIQQAGKRLGMLLSGADGLFTAGTYAITYDYHLTKAKELGLAGAEAETYARNIAERVTDRIAQPTRPGARSLYENTSTNPLARAGWAFASEARKNLALVAYSFAKRDTATKMRTLAYVVAINSIGASILRSIWRDILDDDDDELFDEKYWSAKRIAMAVATEPFYGFPVLGSVVQEAVYKSFGEYRPQGSLFSVDNAVGPIKRLPEYMEGDFEMRDVMRDIDMIVSALGLAHPNIAAAASITHLAKDLFNIGDSAVDAATNE